MMAVLPSFGRTEEQSRLLCRRDIHLLTVKTLGLAILHMCICVQ